MKVTITMLLAVCFVLPVFAESAPAPFAGVGDGHDSLDNSAGPDAGGYRFMDNVMPDTVTYDWIELRGNPEGVTWVNAWSSGHDDACSTVRYPIGFPFRFYGMSYDSFRISTNGFIEFVTASSTANVNGCLPSRPSMGPAICIYWDDLHLDRGGNSSGVDVIGFRNLGTRTVIEFDSIGPYSTTCANSSFKFEAILSADGTIKLQYETLAYAAAPPCTSTQTIGLQANGAPGSAAINYVCDANGIQPAGGRAILFYCCEPPAGVTVYRVDNARVDSCLDIRWVNPVTGRYEIWSTTDSSAPWAPGGVWIVEDTVAGSAGAASWRDPEALQPFKRYVVRHLCP